MLLHMEKTDGVAIKHARKGREYSLPELPHFSVDGYCAETNTVYEILGVIFMAEPVKRFVTSSPQTETHWRPDMNRKLHDWSR